MSKSALTVSVYSEWPLKGSIKILLTITKGMITIFQSDDRVQSALVYQPYCIISIYIDGFARVFQTLF